MTVKSTPGSFLVDNLKGIGHLDAPSAFFDEYERTVQNDWWKRAVQHYKGAVLEGGACNQSYRRLLQHLEGAPGGRRLAGLMLAISVGATWPARGGRSEPSRRCRKNAFAVA
eukprot:5950818-Pyramimonas_sp.AAC.1